MRSYGTEPQIWDGDPNCHHEWGTVHPPGYRSSDTKPGPLQSEGNTNRQNLKSDICTKCGAWKGELGQEPSPELFIKHLTTVFRELRRVLRSDGIFWANIGDSYWGGKGQSGAGDPGEQAQRNAEGISLNKAHHQTGGDGKTRPTDGKHPSLKAKDLIGIPWMLAFALRADGWYLRSDLPWIKRNSMPSSVTDRPASSIEHVFLLTKSGDTTFWTHPTLGATRARPEPDYIYKNKITGEITKTPPVDWKEDPFDAWKRRNLWDGHDYFYDHVATMQPSSESYNKDKRPRGVIRQCVNENGKFPDEGQFKKQDGTGNPTYTGFNARYKAGRERYENRVTEPGMNEQNYGHCGDRADGLRFMRDSDFFFKTWQGLLHNENGEPMALVVNPKGYSGAHFACVDTETECLTISGWKRHDQLREGDDIFTYNMKTGNLEIQPLVGIVSYRYTGDLISVFGRSSNMLMTPNHRCVVTTRDKKVKGGRHPSKIVEARNLKGGMKFPVASRLDFTPYKKFDTPEFYELLGWVLSEGHFKDNGGIGISQSVSKNPQKCERIQTLLDLLKVDFKTWARSRPYKNVISEERDWSINGWARSKIRQMIPDKFRIPENFLLLPDEHIDAFLRGFIGGDGHVRPDARITIQQKEKQPLDIIQAMFIRRGKSCILSQRGNGHWSAFITSAKDRCFKDSEESLVNSNYPYDGLVWCPTVENGTWVARRGGRPFITGNCFPVQLVEPLILAGTSEHGVCPHCGAPWVRQIKRGEFVNQSWGGEHTKGIEAVGGVGESSCLKTGGTCETITTGWSPSCDCYQHKQTGVDIGQSPSSFVRTNKLEMERIRHKEDAKTMYPDDVKKQKEYIAYMHDHGGKSNIQTTGWSPSCSCNLTPVPATVLDPFNGAGSTGVACKQHGRKYVGIDLNPDYCKMATERINESR